MENILKPEVAAKYHCTIEPKPVVLRQPVGDHRIDLRTLTLKEADELVARGFDMLVLKEQEPETDQQRALASGPVSAAAPSGKRSKSNKKE